MKLLATVGATAEQQPEWVMVRFPYKSYKIAKNGASSSKPQFYQCRARSPNLGLLEKQNQQTVTQEEKTLALGRNQQLAIVSSFATRS